MLSVRVSRVWSAGAEEDGPDGAGGEARGGGLLNQPGNQEVTQRLIQGPLVHHQVSCYNPIVLQPYKIK